MIVKLVFQNTLTIPVTLRSNQATGQPVLSGQSLEMTFALEADEDGIAELVLVLEPCE